MKGPLVCLTVALLLAGCAEEGLPDGTASAEYAKGYQQGKLEAVSSQSETVYNDGFADGKQAGYDLGYDDGYDAGYAVAEGAYRMVEHDVENVPGESLSMKSGRYYHYPFSTSRESTLKLKFTTPSSPFDFYVYTSREYNDYTEDASKADPVDSCSDRYVNTGVERTCTLPAGSWQLVVDNTDTGPADPNGTLTTSYTLRVWYTAPAGEG